VTTVAAETLVPADAEVEVCDELNVRMPALDFDAPAAPSIPRQKPSEFIRVVAVGGMSPTLVTDAFTLTIEGFAETETRAQRVCSYAVAAVQAAGRDGLIGAVAASVVVVAALPQNLPMPSVPDRFRFSATVSVTLRRVAV
jgi:hypothetical protein